MKVMLPPLSPYQLIKKLSANKELFASPMSVYLSSGAMLQGVFITVKSDSKDIDGIALKDNQGSLTWIDTRSIVALSLLDPKPEALSLLSEGHVDPLDFVAAPTKLALQREIKEHSHSLQQHFGKEITLEVSLGDLPDGKAVNVLQKLVQDFVSVILEIGSDTFGRGQILEKLLEVSFISGGKRKLQVDKNCLRITFGYQPEQRWQRQELLDEINSLL